MKKSYLFEKFWYRSSEVFSIVVYSRTKCCIPELSIIFPSVLTRNGKKKKGTIINFIVTPEGLEDQILAMIVNVEKPELEQAKQELVRKQNEYKVTLMQLEEDLL
jgi:hypothetical protein